VERIKIEDLPVTENLTPEQEEQVEGAGLRSRRLSLEGLEDRQLMASHLAAALPVPPPALGPALVGQVHTLGSSRLGAAYESDASKVLGQARDIMYKEIIKRGSNLWGLGVRTMNGEKVEQVGNTITITFDLNDRKGPCKAVLKFEGSINGATSTFSLKEAKLEGYHGLGIVGGLFEGAVKGRFANGIKTERFDATYFKDNAIKIAEQLTGKSGFKVNGFVGIENGTVLSLDTGRGELRLTWKYDYTLGGASFLKLSEVYDSTNQFGPGVKQALMDARWWTSARNLGAGANKFGQDVVKYFQGRPCKDSAFVNASDIKANYTVVLDEKGDGATVYVELERAVTYKDNTDIDQRVQLVLTFKLKYDGVTHSFSLKEAVQVQDQSTWKKDGQDHVRKQIDLKVFGTSDLELNQKFEKHSV